MVKKGSNYLRKHKLYLLLVFFLLFSSSFLKAQNQIQAANPSFSHPTITDFKLLYKSVPQPTNGALQVQGIPQMTVSIRPNSGVVRIFLKISGLNNTVIHQVNYLLSSAAVSNNSDLKLFENVDGNIFLSNGSGIALKPYRYEIWTQNGQGQNSPVFSIIQ
jgi:hypothetical protein